MLTRRHRSLHFSMCWWLTSSGTIFRRWVTTTTTSLHTSEVQNSRCLSKVNLKRIASGLHTTRSVLRRFTRDTNNKMFFSKRLNSHNFLWRSDFEQSLPSETQPVYGLNFMPGGHAWLLRMIDQSTNTQQENQNTTQFQKLLQVIAGLFFAKRETTL